MIIDFHSHILPAVDDGSRTVEESVEMLRVMEQQGVDCVVATPHFYPNKMALQEFLRKRDEAYEALTSGNLSGTPFVRCGAEVAFFGNMGRVKQLDCLCIENTDLLLIEMPFRNWLAQDITELERLVDRGIIPILAHIERYYPFQRSLSVFRTIAQLPVYLQLNAESFQTFRMRKITSKIIGWGSPILLGSDCHNLENRTPNLSAGREALQTKYGKGFLQDMDTLGERLLSAERRLVSEAF